MATIFVRAANPIWWLPDLTGVSLNDEYYAFFLTNTLPYIPQAVYQDPAGAVPFSNPIEFSPAGTLPDNLYFDPTLVYRIEVRHGNTQADALIWEINNFVPGAGGGGSTIIDDKLTVSANLITNPQFADIDFASPYTYTQSSPSTYTLPIAPGWDLVLTGSGTTVLTQTANAGSSGIAGNPPYYLDINNSGWTSVVLRQRLENNGAIFGGGAIAVALTAASVSNAEVLTVSYAPSTGSATNIFQRSIPTGTLTAYKNAIDLPASTNSDTGTSAYADILFSMDGTSHFQLTNIQITGQSENLSTGFDNPTDAPEFQELSYEQVENGEFNVYKTSLVTEAKGNLLTGWTFTLNPYQFWTKTLAGVAANQYTLDQTIVVQQAYVSSATATNVEVGQAQDHQNFSLAVQCVTVHNQFAIIQYIDPLTIGPYWGQNLSAMVRAYLATTKSTTVRIKMRLIYNSSLPSSTSQHYPINTWAEGGDPVFAAGWTALTPDNDPSYTLGFNNSGSLLAAKNFSFDKFALPITSGTSTETLGVVIYTIDNMDNSGTPDGIVFDRVSLTPNDFAIDALPETADQTLRKCQYYYEKSYPSGYGPGTDGGATTILGMNSAPAFVYVGDGTRGTTYDDYLLPRSFYLQYKQTKRVAGSLVLYSPNDGASGNVYAGIWQNNANPAATAGANPRNYAASNFSGSGNATPDGVFLLALANSGLSGPNNAILQVAAGTPTKPGDEGIIQYQYTVDARLGV